VTAMSPEAANFNWLLDNFVKSVAGVRHTLVVSVDGLLMAMSDDLDRTSGDQLAAIVAGMSSLTRGAARQLRSVVADAACDVGLVGYEMALLVSRSEATLTPQLVTEMRARLSVSGPTRSPVAG
jgi:predicted regulator of Ras-like GTPase activity (Roadblock/LC7/MglB family)